MTAPRQNLQVSQAPAILPEPVTTNLGLADKHCRMFLELSAQATGLEPEIEAAQVALDRLKARHRKLGTDSTEQDQHARAYHEMAVDHCKKYGFGPMPAPFEDLIEHLKQQMERINPAEVTVSDTQASPIMPTPLDDPHHKVA